MLACVLQNMRNMSIEVAFLFLARCRHFLITLADLAVDTFLSADFLVIGTHQLAPGEENRASPGKLGSVALYSSQHCKCHAIVVKPAHVG